MSDDVSGWVKRGRFQDGTKADYEEASDVQDSLGDDYRAVQIVNGTADYDDPILEERMESGTRWVRVVRFGDSNYPAESLAESLSGHQYRVTHDFDGFYLEREVNDD
jgi:hypothetical protein